jgi:hypothetical protein
MSPKITPDHLGRAAVVYVRQSTMAQVTGNLESQRRQYDLAKAAQAAGFVSVTVIDDDLGRSGSGTMQRPGFERLVAMVCYCIGASRLARNGYSPSMQHSRTATKADRSRQGACRHPWHRSRDGSCKMRRCSRASQRKGRRPIMLTHLNVITASST